MSLGDLRYEVGQLYKESGYTSRQLLVVASRDGDRFPTLHAEIHGVEDRDMIDQWKLSKAGEILRRVRVTKVSPTTGKGRSVREYLAIRTEPEGEKVGRIYHHIDDIAEDPTLTELMKREMERDWKTFRSKYEAFEWFWEHHSELVEGDQDG